MLIQAVFFDIDGTLVDSNDLHVRAWDETFREAGHSFDAATIHSQIGKGSDMLVPSLLPNADQSTIKELGDRHGQIFRERYLSQVQPFPQARSLLKRVHDDAKRVVLASSAGKDELDHYLDLLDAHAFVSAATSADDVEHTKPAPDIFAAALRHVAPLLSDQTIAVGDTPYDAESAGKSGIRTIALRSGNFPEHALRKAGAVAVYDDVAALLAGYDQSPLAK